MRFAPRLCAFACAIFLPIDAGAALGIEESGPPAEQPAVSQSDFKEGSQDYEKQRNFRLEEQRRARMKSQAKGVALIVAPVALLVLVTFLYARSRSGQSRRRSTHRKMKQAEVRRRSGGPDQLLDPRQW